MLLFLHLLSQVDWSGKLSPLRLYLPNQNKAKCRNSRTNHSSNHFSSTAFFLFVFHIFSCKLLSLRNYSCFLRSLHIWNLGMILWSYRSTNAGKLLCSFQLFSSCYRYLQLHKIVVKRSIYIRANYCTILLRISVMDL